MKPTKKDLDSYINVLQEGIRMSLWSSDNKMERLAGPFRGWKYRSSWGRGLESRWVEALNRLGDMLSDAGLDKQNKVIDDFLEFMQKVGRFLDHNRNAIGGEANRLQFAFTAKKNAMLKMVADLSNLSYDDKLKLYEADE